MSRELTGVLLINLGTPSGPDIRSVRRFLREFLSDPAVIALPAPIRWLLLNGIILPFRPRQTAHAYKAIWTKHGSPLFVYSRALQTALSKQLGDHYVVELGMRYNTPRIADAIDALEQKQCKEIIVIPLFPQYASATTGSIMKVVNHAISSKKIAPTITVCRDFFDHPAYIDALTRLTQPALIRFKPEMLLMSYHGLPVKADKGGHYRSQCYTTSQKLADALNLSDSEYIVTFQSRLGRTPWISPYTDKTLESLAMRGIRRVAIVCPSFITDCLETLEEIGIRAREQWQDLGGEDLCLIPCLNDTDPTWASTLIRKLQTK